ncbi:hypothetical protein Pmani_029829 [Petrolisthes manimaculis]|uniref:Uncharacterized protein n=1 Tax=Petrolisthes manimaculis TaxID=1843537 RepID=A0AAE1TTH0_9EUCA|nr:hypothetical protein Pmani_029829 [Petrolisthes manimaculis]
MYISTPASYQLPTPAPTSTTNLHPTLPQTCFIDNYRKTSPIPYPTKLHPTLLHTAPFYPCHTHQSHTSSPTSFTHLPPVSHTCLITQPLLMTAGTSWGWSEWKLRGDGDTRIKNVDVCVSEDNTNNTPRETSQDNNRQQRQDKCSVV